MIIFNNKTLHYYDISMARETLQIFSHNFKRTKCFGPGKTVFMR